MGNVPAFKIIPPPELPGLIARLSASDRLKTLTTAADQYAPILARDVVEYSQKVAGSGPFSSGWQVNVTTGPQIRTVNVYGKARFIDLPTKAHVIRPVKALALAWMPGRGPFSAFSVSAKTKANTNTVFAKSVNHPGTKGKYAYKGALEQSVPKLWNLLIKEITSFLKGG